ncbi:PKD domain-containing protein [Anaerophaga thermohalophila]|uniref:PKD domain-containing protein n=1 Tax=Anaerophaga thermohalophila TaxID=177400 RepID=UPI000237C235|nr:PKD domain-containing protein [Anaerophaga thermohalophila]
MNNTKVLITVLWGLFLLVSLPGCESDDIEAVDFAPEAVDFVYESPSVIHYVVGEEISFINKSIVEGQWHWDFGDGSTSTERDPVHKYSEPGTYTVILSVNEGEFVVSKKLMISDIVPVVSYSSEDSVIVYQQSEVKFDVLLENPEDKEVSYKWNFPSGAFGEGIDENGVSTLAEPTATFGTIGSQNVTLTITLGDKTLAPKSVNVKVHYDKPAKTLYYAVKDGNIMAKKLVGPEVDPSINGAFDLGYRSGKHPLTMDFVGDLLYVFDAGTRTGYVAEYQTAGDGEIFVVSHDGSRRESVVENFGGDTFLDFYYGFVDEEEGNIYWADRREGIFKTSIDTRNRKFSLDEFDYFVRNSWLGYYGKGISWGATNGPIAKVNDIFWWAKNSTSSGLYRFVEGDINPEATPDQEPAAGSLLNSYKIRGMAIDEVNGHIYVAEQNYKMILQFDMEGTLIAAVDRPRTDDGEGGEAESLFVTGMDIDVDENGDGYLYWAYRNNPGEEPASGIKRFKLNDPAAEAEYFIEGVQAYGVAVDSSLR